MAHPRFGYSLIIIASSAMVMADNKHHVHVEKEFIVSNPPWPYSHVCSLTEKDNGDVVATWQAGTNEKNADSSIWTATRSESTGSWTLPTVAVQWLDPIPTCVMNSVQWQNPDNTNELTLVFHAGGGENGECVIHDWVPYLVKSYDGGITWGNQSTFIPMESYEPGVELMGPVKNQCVELSNGEVLCPSSNESVTQDTSHFETTNFQMDSWIRHSDISVQSENASECNDMVQPVIFEKFSTEGKVYALFRTDCGCLAQAESSDYGHTWPAKATLQPLLPTTSAGFDGVVLTNHGTATTAANIASGDRQRVGRGEDKNDHSGSGYDHWWLIAWNNSTLGRSPLTLATSDDEGQSWDHLINVESDPDGTFAYPFLLESRQQVNPISANSSQFVKRVHLCYSYGDGNLSTMAYARIDITDEVEP